MIRLSSTVLIALWLYCAGVESEKLRIVTINNPPFMQKMENGRYQGYLNELVQYLQEKLGITYDIHEVADGRFGYVNEDGTWTGMVGELINDEADLALAPLTVTTERERVIDFSKPILTFNLAAAYKRPEPGQRFVFKTLKDLAGSDLKYFTLQGGSTEAMFKESNFTLQKQMWEAMQKMDIDFPENYEAAIEKVRENPEYVFIGEDSLLYHWVNAQPCDLTIQPLGLTRSYALGFPHGSYRARDFSEELLKMHEDGSLYLLRDKWWKNECSAPKQCLCEEHSSEQED